LEILHSGFKAVHAFGYNSAESEPIWMNEILSTLAIRAEARAGQRDEIFVR